MVHKFTLLIQYEAYAIRILLLLTSLRNCVIYAVAGELHSLAIKLIRLEQSVMFLGSDSRTFSCMFWKIPVHISIIISVKKVV